MLETRRAYIHDIDWATIPPVSAGDTIKVSFLFCGVDHFYEMQPEWWTPIQDSLSVWVNLGWGYQDVDRVSLRLYVLGDPDCRGFEEYIDEWYGWYNFYYLWGYFKDLNWTLVEYEKVVPAPWSDLDYCRVEILLDQELRDGRISDSIFWMDEFKVFVNGDLVWVKDFDPDPESLPPPAETCNRIVTAEREPWLRWNRDAPVCIGSE